MIQIPGTHTPSVKNRSSKQYYFLTKTKPVVKCVSNAVLEEWAKGTAPGVHKEIKRRKEKGRGKNK